MIFLDTNIIIRYLIRDNAEMAEKADEYINSGDAFVTPEVLSEVVHVLKKVYSTAREKISTDLLKIIGVVRVSEPELIIFALEIYGKTNLDFVDCVLFAYHKLYGFEIATFDLQLLKLMARSDSGEES